MNWRRILPRIAGHGAERHEPLSSTGAAEMDAVDRLYAAAPRFAAGPGFRAAVHRRIAAAGSAPERQSAAALGVLLRRPLLAGALAVVLVSVGLTLFGAAHSPVKAEPVLVCQIQGMICAGCAQQVSKILSAVPGVESAEVDVNTGRARVVLKRHMPVSLTQLSAALDESKHFQISDVSVNTEGDKF